jgi:hypothetical protein
MIIGPDFVWLHFPKCAGTSVEKALFALYGERDGFHFDAVSAGAPIWHDTIAMRKERDPTFDIGNRKIIACIRRLPSWILSRVHFEAARQPKYVVTREMLLVGQFFRETGQVRDADFNARRYGTPRVDAWVRTEYLVEDLAKVLQIDSRRVQAALPHENKSPEYVKNQEFWFTTDDLHSLYRSNPIWSEIERQVYGSLLVD